MDLALERKVAVKWREARKEPPTVLGTLLKWGSLPGLLIVGTICVSVLVYLSQLPDSAMSSAWAIGTAGAFIGAGFRDLGIACKVVKLWPIQRELIDWQRIDELLDSNADTE